MRLKFWNWEILFRRVPASPTDPSWLPTNLKRKDIEREVRQSIINDLGALVKERVDNRKGRKTQNDDIIIAVMYRIAGRNPVEEILKNQGLK